MQRVLLVFLITTGTLIGVFSWLSASAETNYQGVVISLTVPSSTAGAYCGNGVVEAGEECDGGGSNGSCPANCSSTCAPNSCGDGATSDTTSVLIKAKPEKRFLGESGQRDNFGTIILLSFFDPNSLSSPQEMVLATNDQGEVIIDKNNLPDLAPFSGWSATVKGLSHLTKKIINVDVIRNQRTVWDFTANNQNFLLAGDVQARKDDVVDVQDISATLTAFGAQKDKNADLNNDGVVDVQDISIILPNFGSIGDK